MKGERERGNSFLFFKDGVLSFPSMNNQTLHLLSNRALKQ